MKLPILLLVSLCNSYYVSKYNKIKPAEDWEECTPQKFTINGIVREYVEPACESTNFVCCNVTNGHDSRK